MNYYQLITGVIIRIEEIVGPAEGGTLRYYDGEIKLPGETDFRRVALLAFNKKNVVLMWKT
jgi:hypothetical protein